MQTKPSRGSERASSAIQRRDHWYSAEISPTPKKKEARSKKIATVRIETNFRQGDLGVEVDSVEGDLAETENSLAVFFFFEKNAWICTRPTTHHDQEKRERK